MKTFFNKYLHNSIALCVVLSIILNIVIESVGRRSFLLCMDYFLKSPMTFLYNAFIIFATFSVIYFVKRRILGYVIVTMSWLGIGITNGIILGFRTTPFTVTDLSLFEDGLAILPNYLSVNQMILAGIVIAVLIIGLILLFIFAPKHKKKIDFKRSLIGLLIISFSLFGVSNIAVSEGWVSSYFGNLNYAYRDYGVPYCFVNTWLNTGISAPNYYSSNSILGILTPEELAEEETLPESDIPGTNIDKPNIVMLQLESFFDPNLIKGLQYSEDPVPNFRELKEKYSSGYLTVPVIGAGTANTEFEALTGMSLRFFGPGEYPYKSVLKKKSVESINYDLKKLGYSAHAIHNHRGMFYGRNEVFSNLGFDTFTSVEYMNSVFRTPMNYEKDAVLTGEILAALNSTENEDFIYTISVQGHGKYPTKKIYENPEVTFSGIEEESDANAFEYYLQQVHEMDKFIGALTEELKKFDEDTVLVLYGDHLPGLNLSNEDLINNNIYQTEYVIWSNFSMKEKDKDLYTYQIGAEVLKRLNISTGIMTKYHQNHSEDLTYQNSLKALQYDMLYGEEYIYGGTSPYTPTKLKMGINPIKVDEIIMIGDGYYIKGQNFTPYSKISIDGKVQETIFLGPNILGLLEKDVNPDDAAKMKVSQIDKSLDILSTTE